MMNLNAFRPLIQSLSFPALGKPCLSLDLAPGQVWAGQAKAGTRVHCRRGRVWLTMEGEAEDVVLAAGEAGRLLKDGRVVAQGLGA